MTEIYRYINKKWLIVITLIFAFCLIFAVGSGCSVANIFKLKEIANNLHDKYGEDFTFIRSGDKVGSSSYMLWRYANSAGEEFYVRIDRQSGVIVDNYQSVKYDTSFANKVNYILNNKYIVIVSTKTSYFGLDEIFHGYEDYISSCKGFDIKIYSRCEPLPTTDLNKLTSFSSNYYSVGNAVLTADLYDKYKQSTNPYIDSGFITTYDYKIENGVATLR